MLYVNTRLFENFVVMLVQLAGGFIVQGKLKLACFLFLSASVFINPLASSQSLCEG